MEFNIGVSPKQKKFLDCYADEVLYGGAAGGGKSYAQLIDAFLYAMKYPNSRQLILRRTYAELEKSLIRVHLGMYPRNVYRYNDSKHTGKFVNGSVIDFGYCDKETDVYQYMSSEYDVIRFDELTHFTEDMYVYLMSRIRGANNYPKSIKCSTNPGNVGHQWVKARFIDACVDGHYEDENGTRVFIPATVQENIFLMQKDPGYIKRLQKLSEKDRKALLYGEWDIFDGQYFSEFRREIHVIRPFEIPKHWRRYFAMDYGLDMLAGYVIAVDDNNKAYVIKELYESGLIIPEAAKKVKELCEGEDIYAYFAPPDMWNKRQETGKSMAEIFYEHGITLAKANNNRVHGWMDVKSWLQPYEDEQGIKTANLLIFENCKNLIRCLPALVFDNKNPNDVAKEPHELTHAPDALRYFIAGRPLPNEKAVEVDEDVLTYDQQVTNFLNF